MSQISSGFQRAGSKVVRICSHLRLPPSPPHRSLRSRIHRITPCVSVSLILEWSRGTRASSDRYTLRRSRTYTRGSPSHDTARTGEIAGDDDIHFIIIRRRFVRFTPTTFRGYPSVFCVISAPESGRPRRRNR